MKNVEGGFDGGEGVGLFLASRRVGTRRSLIVFARFYVEAETSERSLIFQQPIVRVILLILLQPSWCSVPFHLCIHHLSVQFDRSFDVRLERDCQVRGKYTTQWESFGNRSTYFVSEKTNLFLILQIISWLVE